MSRIRSIHPGLWTDEGFMSVSAYARLLYIGLWNEAWDDGVFEWKPLTLKAKIFPVDSVDLPGLLDELVSAGMIARMEDAPRQAGVIRNFQRFQRPKKPNSSGLLVPEWEEYVGKSATPPLPEVDTPPPVPHQFPTSSEKSPQMEEEGGRRKEENTNSRSVVEAKSGARDLFGEVWETFPRNPASVERLAEQAFRSLSASEQVQCADMARHYRRWFDAEQKERGRSAEAGARFVPFLSKWIETGAWLEAESMGVKGDRAKVVVPMTRLDRSRDADLWAACEKIMGRKAPTSDFSWAFAKEVVARAKASLERVMPHSLGDADGDRDVA
jgi:hypothetical protein